MALLFVNQGEDIALNIVTKKSTQEELDLILYTAPTTSPGETLTESGVTEATFTGYTTESLTASNWVLDPGVDISYPKVTFTSSAGSQNQDVYGYAVIQRTSGKLMYVEEFTDGPYNIANDGDKIEVTLVITAD